ncbi:Alpha/Beta hydrolase protein [Gorgonomyces haynaldii]|nr:Alpha/Beta hydrolase protein [Gorgonomyces haynaldii]
MLSFFAVGSALAFSSLTQTLSYVTLQGGQAGNVQYWLNIPFGKAPVGSLRFAPPQAPGTITGTRNATVFGPGCYQSGGLGYPAAGQSEDCLNLNVYVPATATATSKLPVVVYVYGGSFNSGFNSQANYDGRLTLQGGAQFVLVTINYRVGPFGFLASKPLASKGYLNAGLLDQKLAFEWVRANIAKFGGDATKVTAMGWSAGAISVGFHMIAQGGTQKLFDKAILLSGAPMLFFPDADTAQPGYDYFLQATGCSASTDTVACLQSVDPATLQSLSNQASLSWQPTLDGTYLPFGSQEAYILGAYSKIPVWLDTVANEGSVWNGKTPDLATSKTWVASTYPFLSATLQNKVQSMYNITSYASPLLQSGAIFGDTVFYCPVSTMGTFYGFGGQKVYKSLFNKQPTVPLFQGAQYLGVHHGANLAFFFQITPLLGTADEVALAKRYLSDMVGFAAGTYTPPAYSVGQVQYVTPVANISTIAQNAPLQKCAFWATTSAIGTLKMQFNIPLQ